MRRFNPLIEVEDDKLLVDEVRNWSKEKYKLVGTYCDIFTAGMKNKWENLIYIDLFSGSGYSKIKNTNKIYKNSALIALSVPNKFSKYILCEKDPEKCNALKTRVERDFSHCDVMVIEGDCNKKVDQIFDLIPMHSKTNRVLSFCFADPYSLDFEFSTIATLGKKIMDFLILQALHMDANRNFELYYKLNNKRIGKYLGNDKWREIFNNQNIVKFLADQYQLKMTELNYQNTPLMHQIHSDEKKLPLYYLSFYSKSARGVEFFNKVEKYISPQLSLNI